MAKCPQMTWITESLAQLLCDRCGNIAVMTALMMPVMAVTTLGGVSMSFALAHRQELMNIAQLTCNRTIKPTRMTVLTDAERLSKAQAFFDSLAADHKLTIDSRTVTVGWLTSSVQATATVPIMTGVETTGAGMTGPSLTLNVSVTCNGLPPFPKKGDTILTSNFVKPDGTNLPMKYGNWGIYKATEFGWDGGDGPGVEIQDWSRMGWMAYRECYAKIALMIFAAELNPSPS